MTVAATPSNLSTAAFLRLKSQPVKALAAVHKKCRQIILSISGASIFSTVQVIAVAPSPI